MNNNNNNYYYYYYYYDHDYHHHHHNYNNFYYLIFICLFSSDYYLANIALNLEACINSGVNLTICLKLVLQKLSFRGLCSVHVHMKFPAVLAQTNTRCVQCLASQ